MRISVVIPCYNMAAYVTDALDSVRVQDEKDLEIIVIDDASTDASPEVISRWAELNDCDVIVHRKKANEGLAKAVNTGLDLARGSYYTQLDADDVLAPGVLARHARILDHNPGCGVVYGDVNFVSRDLADLLEPYMSGKPAEGDILAELARHGSVLPLVGTVMRTNLVRDVGGYDIEVSYQDWPLWLALAKLTTFRYSGELAGMMRRHPNSMSVVQGRETRASRLDVLRKLLAEDLTPEVRAAGNWRARQTALQMWTWGDGRGGASECWRFATERRSARVGALAALMASGVPASPIRRVVRRINPTTWD